MGTVASYPVATSTAYGNQRKIDRCQNGVLWTVVTGGGLDLFPACSTDGGATWTSGAQLPDTGSATNYTTNSSLFIDLDDYAHVVTKDSASGYIFYVRGTPNVGRTAYAWSSPAVLWDGNSFDHADIVAHRDPAVSGAWVAHVVMSRTDSTTQKCYYERINIAANGTITAQGPSGLLNISTPLAIANSNSGYPSIEFNHTGDGKTVAAGAPHLVVGWSAGATGSGYGIRFRKATYSAGSWTWGTEREIDNARCITDPIMWLNCLFDGTRVILVGELSNGSLNGIAIYERDAADTATTNPLPFTAYTDGAEQFYAGSSSYDSLGNIYIFGTAQASGTAHGTRKLSYRKWTRSGATLGPRVDIDTTAPNYPYISARRGPQGQAIDYVYTDGTTSPYEVKSGRIVLNQNPTAATPLTPADNATIDSSTDQTVTMGYSDPDGNSASKARVCYRPKGTTVPYAVLEVNTTAPSGSTISVPVLANTWPGDINWYGQVADSSGSWSDPSAVRTVTGIPAALAAATGGAGGTDAKTLALSNRVESDRAQRSLGRTLKTTVTIASPLTITIDGGPVTATRNAGYTPAVGDLVEASYITDGWVVRDKVVS